MNPRIHISYLISYMYPDSKVHGDNMGPIWSRYDPGGPHDGPMNFAIKEYIIRMTESTHDNNCTSGNVT